MTRFTTEEIKKLILEAWMIQACLTIVAVIAPTSNSLMVIGVHALWAALVTIACTLWRKHLMQESMNKNDE